ncbi:unnamed protein product [Notodromas monacha]|uniref:K Homology domain-containing protein n=1 Tax=Notodromas monacha TaxID=399045 RepID=A0A7R9GEM1_9CRUS|nr:unnamed protein product [Notodromas monacha]CAG0919884.1 unnamed protein product [Notodromas monacha]
MGPGLGWSQVHPVNSALENVISDDSVKMIHESSGKRCIPSSHEKFPVTYRCSMNLDEDETPFSATDRFMSESERQLMEEIRKRSKYCRCFLPSDMTWGKAHCCGCRLLATNQSCCLPSAMSKMAQTLSVDRWWTPPCCPPNSPPKPTTCPPLPPVGAPEETSSCCPKPCPPKPKSCPPKPKPCPPKPCPPKPCPPKPCPEKKKKKCCPPCVKPCPDEDRPKPTTELCPLPRPFPPEIPEDKAPCPCPEPEPEPCPRPKPKPCPAEKEPEPPCPPIEPPCPKKKKRKTCPLEANKTSDMDSPLDTKTDDQKNALVAEEKKSELQRGENAARGSSPVNAKKVEQKDAPDAKQERKSSFNKDEIKEDNSSRHIKIVTKSKLPVSHIIVEKTPFSAAEDEEEYSDCEATRRLLSDKLKEVSFECDDPDSGSLDDLAEITSKRGRDDEKEEQFSDAGEPLRMNFEQSACCRYCGKFYPDPVTKYPSPGSSKTTSSCSSVASLASDCSENSKNQRRRNNVHLSLLMDPLSDQTNNRRDVDGLQNNESESCQPRALNDAPNFGGNLFASGWERSPAKRTWFQMSEKSDFVDHGDPVLSSEDEVMSHLMGLCAQLGLGYIEADMASWGLPLLATNVKVFAEHLEAKFPDEMDQAFVVLRNACCDMRLPVTSRLKFLELVELRARKWSQEDRSRNFYSSMAKHFPEGAKEQEAGLPAAQQTSAFPARYSLSHSVSAPHLAPMMLAAAAAGYQPQQTLGNLHAGLQTILTSSQSTIPGSSVGHSSLNHGEVMRGSGKYPAGPTKVPGKNYFRDEVVIRNADSGKVMGIKGRRVHMIEQMSETVISFQRVAPGTKDRLVQITGPAEGNVRRAKQLIEETICRNSSPMQSDEEADDAGDLEDVGSSGSEVDILPRGRSELLSCEEEIDAVESEASFSVTVFEGSSICFKMIGPNLRLLNMSKLALEELFEKNLDDSGFNCDGLDNFMDRIGEFKKWFQKREQIKETVPRLVYTRESLLEIAKHQLSMVTPACLPWLVENAPWIVRQDLSWEVRDCWSEPRGNNFSESSSSESDAEDLKDLKPIPRIPSKMTTSERPESFNEASVASGKSEVQGKKEEVLTAKDGFPAHSRSSSVSVPVSVANKTKLVPVRLPSAKVQTGLSVTKVQSRVKPASKAVTVSAAESLAAKVDAMLRKRPANPRATNGSDRVSTRNIPKSRSSDE